ncbi:Dynamin-like protein C [Durusdinium trenchii]|uniref:Dynamin-like protein C n=1 Tax=Durusdinium trenchii TaxID=1381693 RepID=A0ABP0L8H0_9DINO
MSRFSSIDGQHSALRDLERQRLEKLMGQLRREVEPNAKASGRRFQPPRRKERVSKVRPEGGTGPYTNSSAPRPAPQPAPPPPAVPAPGPGTPRNTTVTTAIPISTPSAEMAWLLRVSEKFDQDAEQVQCFLAQHGLEQYASLLEDGPGAPGSSMEALRAASIEMLEQVGLPPSPRRRLQHALEVEVELDSPEQGDEPHNSPSIVNWGRLGRMPAGWHQRPTGERSRLVVTRSEPVSHADAAVGDDSPIRAVEAPSINDVTIPTMAMKTMAEAGRLLGMGAQAGQAKPARSIMRVLLALLPRQAVARRAAATSATEKSSFPLPSACRMRPCGQEHLVPGSFAAKAAWRASERCGRLKTSELLSPYAEFELLDRLHVYPSIALAGETFNFVSGTLGSRRPTVLEFRNVPGLSPSRWSVFDESLKRWDSYPVQEVMHIVGSAHEACGQNVSEMPIRVKVEGEDCTDLGLVDLPGFRSYAKDDAMQQLAKKIDSLVFKFMNDENNIMLCVEEAGDAAGFATLGKAKQVDPTYKRTILIRNKLDKYYGDLTTENVNKWLEGYGDLPQHLARFAVSLPHWTGEAMPKPFGEMRKECSDIDMETLTSKGASSRYKMTIGFQNFRNFMEIKIQQLFADALAPMLTRLKNMQEEHEKKLEVIRQETETINEDNILHATRSAGITFAQSFIFLMEGALSSEHNRCTLEEELKAFHAYCARTDCLKDEELMPISFEDLDSYVAYLRDTVKLPAMDVSLNGGAQFRRLMYEVEVFTRFAGLGKKLEPVDVIQARGSGLRDITWQDTITQLMMQNAPTRMRTKTKYVGERLKFFFGEQKEATVQFMLGLQGSPEEHMFSRLIPKQAQVIERNDTMKRCIFEAFDTACDHHRVRFMQMWCDFMDSMFQSPLMLLKSGSMPSIGDGFSEEIAPTFESTKARIVQERNGRGTLQTALREKVKQIPDDDVMANESVKMVQRIIEQTFAVIRSVVADHMQLYSESFFLLPMLRRLEGVMAQMELQEEDKNSYRARKSVLDKEKAVSQGMLADLTYCVEAVQRFKVTYGGGQ